MLKVGVHSPCAAASHPYLIDSQYLQQYSAAVDIIVCDLLGMQDMLCGMSRELP